MITISGGSYNYLHTKTTGELGPQDRDLLTMLDRLERIGYATAAAANTRRVVDLLIEVQHAINDLSTVWHAVEWRDSSDWSDEQLRAALIIYEADHLGSTVRVGG